MADVNVEAGQKAFQNLMNLLEPSLRGSNPAIFVKVDVSVENDIKSAVELAESTFGKLNVVFNNAGIMHPNDDNAVTTEEKVWDLTMNINVKGVWFGCRHAIAALRRAGGGIMSFKLGSIINTASFVAVMGAATPQLAYTASKGAVLALTRELATVHARENIRFNSLCPGPIRTPLLMNFLDNEAKKQRRLVHVPMGRFGEAIEQAYAGSALSNSKLYFLLLMNLLLSLVLISLLMGVYQVPTLRLKVQQVHTAYSKIIPVFDENMRINIENSD